MTLEDSNRDWFKTDEGQLSVDVFKDGHELVIRSPIAGVDPKDIEISVNGDLLTIRGKRETRKDLEEDNWYYRECYWGAFSRSIVLPHHVAPDKTEASLKNGVLEIRVPILDPGKSFKVKLR